MALGCLCAALLTATAQSGREESAAGASTRGDELRLIAGAATASNRTLQTLEELCDLIGERLTGTPAEEEAGHWALKKMRAAGLENVRLEPWQLAHGWKRVYARANFTYPGIQSLTVAAAGWTGSTERGGSEGAVIGVDRNLFTDKSTGPTDKWAGSILYLRGVVRDSRDSFSQMGHLLELAKSQGALAVIAGDGPLSFTGTNLIYLDPPDYSGGFYDVPLVIATSEGRKLLERLLDSGVPVRLKIDVQNEVTSKPVTSHNVVGEIRGTESPDDIIVVGAHLDSWDLGQGATDDGFGTACVLGAATAIKSSGYRPKKTIRFILFTGEEQGILGSMAYVRTHAAELPKHVAALIVDQGDGPIAGIQLNGREDVHAMADKLIPLIGLGSSLEVNDSLFLFSDAFSFTLAGIPGIDWEQNSPDYRYTHHSAADTFDKVHGDVLNRDSAVIALAAFWIADSERIAPRWTREQTREMLRKQDAEAYLRRLHLWPFDSPETSQPVESGAENTSGRH